MFIVTRARASHIFITEKPTKEKQKRFSTNKMYNKMDFVLAAAAAVVVIVVVAPVVIVIERNYLFRYKLPIINVSICS